MDRRRKLSLDVFHSQMSLHPISMHSQKIGSSQTLPNLSKKHSEALLLLKSFSQNGGSNWLDLGKTKPDVTLV